MKIPSRYAPVLFGALLSAIMVCVVSGTVLVMNNGLHDEFLQHWLSSGAMTWLIAFPTVTLVAPWVRKAVAALTV